MNKFSKIIFLIFFLPGTFYLCLPSPNKFPDLPGAVKSTEPGDTTQIANVSAYYTDTPRDQTVKFYYDYFSRSPFLGIPLITYKLNHPPEKIREVLRSTQQSTYVEEIVHPLRESVFVNGFEWNNDPFTPSKNRVKNILVVNGKTYRFKVTLFYQESKLWQRLLIFYLVLLSSCLVSKAFGEIIKRFKND